MEKTPTSCVSSLRMTICVWTSGIASRKPTPPCTLQCEKTLGASSAGAATAFASSRRGADVWSAATAGGAFTRSAERAPAGRAARAMDHTALRMPVSSRTRERACACTRGLRCIAGPERCRP